MGKEVGNDKSADMMELECVRFLEFGKFQTRFHVCLCIVLLMHVCVHVLAYSYADLEQHK